MRSHFSRVSHFTVSGQVHSVRTRVRRETFTRRSVERVGLDLEEGFPSSRRARVELWAKGISKLVSTHLVWVKWGVL